MSYIILVITAIISIIGYFFDFKTKDDNKINKKGRIAVALTIVIMTAGIFELIKEDQNKYKEESELRERIKLDSMRFINQQELQLKDITMSDSISVLTEKLGVQSEILLNQSNQTLMNIQDYDSKLESKIQELNRLIDSVKQITEELQYPLGATYTIHYTIEFDADENRLSNYKEFLLKCYGSRREFLIPEADYAYELEKMTNDFYLMVEFTYNRETLWIASEQFSNPTKNNNKLRAVLRRFKFNPERNSFIAEYEVPNVEISFRSIGFVSLTSFCKSETKTNIYFYPGYSRSTMTSNEIRNRLAKGMSVSPTSIFSYKINSFSIRTDDGFVITYAIDENPILWSATSPGNPISISVINCAENFRKDY